MVMADEVLDRTDMVRQLFGEGQRVPDEAGDALPQRLLEALDVMRFPGVLRDSWVSGCQNDPGVDRLLLRIACRPLAVHRRQIGPQLLRPCMTAVTDVARKNLPCLFVHRNPHPLLVGLVRHEALHLIRFYLETPDDHLLGSHDGQPMEMVRPWGKAGYEKRHEPSATDVNRAAHARPRELLAQATCHQGPLLRGQDALGGRRRQTAGPRPGIDSSVSRYAYDHCSCIAQIHMLDTPLAGP